MAHTRYELSVQNAFENRQHLHAGAFISIDVTKERLTIVRSVVESTLAGTIAQQLEKACV